MEAGYLVSNKTESSPRQGREGRPGRLAWGGGRGGEGGGVCVHYAQAKAPDRELQQLQHTAAPS